MTVNDASAERLWDCVRMARENCSPVLAFRVHEIAKEASLKAYDAIAKGDDAESDMILERASDTILKLIQYHAQVD